MSRLVVVDGDELQFETQFGARMVTPTGPAKINGSGHATINGKRICVKGDEKKVTVQANYQSGSYQGGQGIITIKMLASDQEAPRCTSGAAIILKGKKFTALFTVTVPGTSPSGDADSSSPESDGNGSFDVRQKFVTAG
ncbi:hypothetical protein [Burkholderia sp. MSMB1589WGS]|uniref:hypothetical protein n=1 Tax=Burkholderia sp. MSMB1589WGS TaxID=1636425 RepID=UPI0018D377ED|nr:hypothetical protein [Burkholderia sp. MSMB1589WGS]